MDNYIIQEYIREPYLIDGFKFGKINFMLKIFLNIFSYPIDLRIYALITSCDPLRVFIFNNGLIRMCSKKYVIPTPKNAVCFNKIYFNTNQNLFF
jgi:tubulin polyglutamylase TTLL7